MRNTFRAALAALLALAFVPYDAHAISRNFSYNVDVRNALGHIDVLGADFDIRYELAQESLNPAGNHFSALLSTSGFQTFDRAVTDVNSTSYEAALVGRYFKVRDVALTPEQTARLRELSAKDSIGGGPGLTEAEHEEYMQLLGGGQKARRHWSYRLRGIIESTQDFDRRQYAFGAGLSGEVPMLHEMLDKIPALTRNPGTVYDAQPVRIHMGGDWVTHMADSTQADGTAASGRVIGQVAWSTPVANGLILRATYEGEYLFSPPEWMATDQQFNSRFQAWILVPVKDGASLMVKWLDGRWAPDYISTSGPALGLNVSFQ
jgi:hypothetical protein